MKIPSPSLPLPVGLLCLSLFVSQSVQADTFKPGKKDVAPANGPAPAAPAAVAVNSPTAQTFIETLNNLRQTRGLAAMRLDPQIQQSAQWLADHMAKFDVMDHDAVVIGGKEFAKMRELGDRLKVFGFPDNGAAEACAEGEYDDIHAATRDFTLGWANGKTHYRPFLSKDGQVFETCGFGIAASKKNPKRYYACALFANRDDSAAPAPAPAPAAAGDPKAPAKVAMPEGAAPAAPGTAVGGMVLQYAPGWTTVLKDGTITSVNPEGSARVIVTSLAGPKDAQDGPWDAVQAKLPKLLASHLTGFADFAEVDTEHDVVRDGVGLRVITCTGTLQGKSVNIVVDFARENNAEGERLVLIIRCSEQGDQKNEAAARKVAESLRLKK